MKIFIIFLLCFVSSVSGKEKVVGRMYFNQFLGHLHQNADNDSTSLTIVQCSHSVKLLKKKNVIGNWSYVKVGDDIGYIRNDFLSSKRPDCFQEKYQKFYNAVKMDITEMYFWGRLSDHYIDGKSRVK